MNSLINFIGFQVSWWLLIVYQNQFWWMIAGLLIVHFIRVKTKLVELLTALAVTSVGVAVDCLLAVFDVYIFTNPGQFFPIPVWLILLWSAFSATLRHSLGYLQNHYLLGAVLGAIGGPLSYIGGMKMGAVAFGVDVVNVILLLAVIWACLMPLFFYLIKRIELTWLVDVDLESKSSMKENQ